MHALANCRTPAHLAPIVHVAPIVGPIHPSQVVYDGSQDGRVQHAPCARPIVASTHVPVSKDAYMRSFYLTVNVHRVGLFVPRRPGI